MNRIINVDRTLRLIFSMIFRIVLMVYGFIIWYYSDENFFTPWVYMVVGVVYLVCYTALFNKTGIKSILRLTLDFILIGIFLYGKQWNLITVCYLLLPLLNAPNHSGEKRSVYIYVLYVVAVVVLSYPEMKLSYIFILAILVIIERFERLRARLLRFSNSLTDMIEQFEISATKMQKVYEVYASVINSINSSKFRNFYSIKHIICMKASEGHLVLVNGSIFLYTVSVSFSAEEIERMRMGRPVDDKACVVNDEVFAKNVCMGIVIGEDMFVYILIVEKAGWLRGLSSISIDFLRPLFYRISKLILFDWQIKIERALQINKIKSRINYVNSAILAMHFLRNKFSPIKGYFETLNLVDSTTDQSMREQLLAVNKTTRDRVNNSINLILQRANLILEKSENPFVISEFTKSSFRKIFDVTRKVWVDHFCKIRSH